MKPERAFVVNGATVSKRDMDRAIAAFVRSYCFQRNFAQPHFAEQVGGVWRLFDEPGAKARREEYVAHDLAPKKVHQLVRRLAQRHYCITAIFGPVENGETLRDAYKGLGYRFNNSEAFMRHTLKRIPRVVSPVTIRRVSTVALAEKLAKAARRRQILPEHLVKNPPQRSYVALVDEKVIGWANSVVDGEATYCAGMYVAPAYRRRGIARSLLAKMLRDDRAGGAAGQPRRRPAVPSGRLPTDRHCDGIYAEAVTEPLNA
jgi:GNAT superfamily N-acetyltransferase